MVSHWTHSGLWTRSGHSLDPLWAYSELACGLTCGYSDTHSLTYSREPALGCHLIRVPNIHSYQHPANRSAPSNSIGAQRPNQYTASDRHPGIRSADSLRTRSGLTPTGLAVDSIRLGSLRLDCSVESLWTLWTRCGLARLLLLKISIQHPIGIRLAPSYSISTQHPVSIQHPIITQQFDQRTRSWLALGSSQLDWLWTRSDWARSDWIALWTRCERSGVTVDLAVDAPAPAALALIGLAVDSPRLHLLWRPDSL
jgi:hypothetical protein